MFTQGARLHTCTYLAAVISALEQAMKLKLTPFYEMGFLAVTVLSGFKFFAKCDKHQGYSPCFFFQKGFKSFTRIIAEIIDQEVRPPCGRLLEVRV